MIKFTKTAVGEWFEAQGDNRVGQAGEPDDCPLANYFHAHDDLLAEVFHHTRRMYTSKGFREVTLPQWARTFVEQIDIDDNPREFTGTQALLVLRNQKPIPRQTIFETMLAQALAQTQNKAELVSA